MENKSSQSTKSMINNAEIENKSQEIDKCSMMYLMPAFLGLFGIENILIARILFFLALFTTFEKYFEKHLCVPFGPFRSVPFVIVSLSDTMPCHGTSIGTKI